MNRRYVLALLSFIAAWFGLGFLLDAIPIPALATGVFLSPEEAQEAQRFTILWLNSIVAVQTFLAYAVGAYILRRNAMIPGLLIYVLMALPAVWILHKIALPAQPSITIVEIVTGNLSGWVVSILACVAGLLLGERMAKYRWGSRANAL